MSEHRLDVADADAVAALPDAVVAEHGRVSVLVNNAGVALGGRFEAPLAAGRLVPTSSRCWLRPAPGKACCW